MHRTFQNYREYSAAWANYSPLADTGRDASLQCWWPGPSLFDTQGWSAKSNAQYLPIYVPIVATVAASQISIDVCKNEISRCNTRGQCRNLSRFLPASTYVARGFKVLVAAALGKEKEEEEEGFWHGQEHLAPCDRFDPEHSALMAIVCRCHTLLAISSESSVGEWEMPWTKNGGKSFK